MGLSLDLCDALSFTRGDQILALQQGFQFAQMELKQFNKIDFCKN